MKHQRAKLFVELGKALVEKHGGSVLNSIEDPPPLPSAGAYTANAVLCFACGKNTVIVDTNAVGVFRRVFGFRSRKRRPKDDPALWKFARRIAPADRAKEFNFAVIDFAHSICTPRKPHCHLCPLSSLCRYAKGGSEEHEN
jgi:A/G-specific adenine glycosylase